MSSKNDITEFSESDYSISVGVDLVSIERIRRILERWGSRFTTRCFTNHEIETCKGRVSSLASRFAAKEPAYKALSTNRKGITWLDIEVRTADSGSPGLRFYGVAADESRRQGWNSVSLSLSHDAGVAIAVVSVLKRNVQPE